MARGCTVVVDIGKTHSKASLWCAEGQLLDKKTRANAPIDAAGYAALDVETLTDWLFACLSEFARTGEVARIVPVAHGAAAAVLKEGGLLYPPMDYEDEPNPQQRERYAAQRDDFTSTGSPLLPCGLNLGLQLHRLEDVHGPLPADATIVPWPQYWAWCLSGVAASEVTSLGCHTDLWRPLTRTFSSLAINRGWAARMAPLRAADESLGPITREVAARTGLPATCEVMCGLHDSNAALLAARGHADIANTDATVLSTGTWFVAMRSLANPDALTNLALSEERDCLMNVDASGKPVPSARFMGGREAELIGGIDSFALTVDYEPDVLIARMPEVIASGAMAYPSFVRGVGPFPSLQGGWRNKPSGRGDQRIIAGLYLALMADAALELIGSRDRLLIEGRFAEAVIFARALATLRPQQRIFTANAHQDVAYGALRLVQPQLTTPTSLTLVKPLEVDLTHFAAEWRAYADAAASPA